MGKSYISNKHFGIEKSEKKEKKRRKPLTHQTFADQDDICSSKVWFDAKLPYTVA